jgi:hypothetical protein
MQKSVSGGGMAIGYEYKVVELREGLLGARCPVTSLRRSLTTMPTTGGSSRPSTAVEVKGRVGPGGVDGELVTFERPRG